MVIKGIRTLRETGLRTHVYLNNCLKASHSYACVYFIGLRWVIRAKTGKRRWGNWSRSMLMIAFSLLPGDEKSCWNCVTHSSKAQFMYNFSSLLFFNGISAIRLHSLWVLQNWFSRLCNFNAKKAWYAREFPFAFGQTLVNTQTYDVCCSCIFDGFTLFSMFSFWKKPVFF